MLIVDAHADLAWNILSFGRDYTLSAHQIRQREAGSPAREHNGDALLGWREYQLGGVALVFATLFATPYHRREPWEVLVYANPQEANRLYRQQLDLYHRLADQHAGKFQLVKCLSDLQSVLAQWEAVDLPTGLEEDDRDDPEVEPLLPDKPVGLVILMEGAEGVRAPGELAEWWERGVRLIGPAWAGTRFCGGTREPGPLTKEGYALLDAMADQGFMLDLSHMDERAALQALDFYSGQVVATHGNALSLLKGSESNRHLSDRVIHGIIERDGVIGVVPLNKFLKVGWQKGDPRELVSLNDLVAHIDHICQILTAVLDFNRCRQRLIPSPICGK